MNKKILLADDEYRMRKLIGDFLKKQGFTIIEAEDGKKARDAFFDNPGISLVILDVMMPVYDGWTVCREIRKSSRVPIIMLTARSEESDQIFGFDLGADEYITKPFSPNILVARVQALLRRAEESNKGVKNLAGVQVDEPRHYVSVDGNGIELTPKEFELLVYLMDNEGKVLSRDQILDTVWDYNYFGDARTVDTHIKKLRQKLGEKGELIKTVRGLGYRFEVNQ